MNRKFRECCQIKRILALALTPLLLAAALAGCGKTPAGTQEPTPEPTPTWTTTVEDETVDDNFIINTETRKVDEINKDRGGNELIYYTRMRGETTKTNPYGKEALVQDGRVAKLGGNSMETPDVGFIISGNGTAAVFIDKYLPIGAKVDFDHDAYAITITMDKQAYMDASNAALREIADMLERYRSHNSIADQADEKVAEIKALVAVVRASSDGNEIAETYDKILDLCSEAYTYAVPSFSEETRAVWHIINQKTPEAVDDFVRVMSETGFNVILLEAFARGYVIYPDSEYCKIMPDTDNGFDVLQAFVDAGNKYNVEIHACVVNFFVGDPGYKYDNNVSGSPIIDEHPDWVARTKDGTPYAKKEAGFIYMNPALPEVRQFLLDVYSEMIERYDIKGINLDYIRYTDHGSIDEAMGFDDYSKAKFLEDTGIDIMTVTDMGSDDWKTFINWRAEFISDFVSRLRGVIDEKNAARDRSVRLSACVVGEAGVAQNIKSQDWEKWLAEGWLDFICPMTYYEYDGSTTDEITRMVTTYPSSVNVAGLSPWGGMKLALVQGQKQIMAARQSGAMGIAVFYSGHLDRKVRETLKQGVFRTPATPLYELRAR